MYSSCLFWKKRVREIPGIQLHQEVQFDPVGAVWSISTTIVASVCIGRLCRLHHSHSTMKYGMKYEVWVWKYGKEYGMMHKMD